MLECSTAVSGQVPARLADLRPRSCPPLGRAYSVVAGSPGLWTVLGAVFAVDRPVGAIVERLHALHHPCLVAKLPTGFAAGTPLFHHPPVSTASFHVIQQLHFSSPVVKIHCLSYLPKIARMTYRWPFRRSHFYDFAVARCMEGQIPYYTIVRGHLRRWAAVLHIAAFPDRFGLFAGFTKVPMH